MKLMVLTSSILLVMLFTMVQNVWADRGIIPVQPNVSVYEPGQKAIIAWNGTTEILVLSTDIFADSSVKAVEILPLPSNPTKVELASVDSFFFVQQLIWSHLPFVLREDYGSGSKDVSVVFHERIGMHDITVVEAGSLSGLVDWVSNFLEDNGISGTVSMEGFEPVLRDYLLRAFRFFVLDLIELSPESKSAEPVLYQFETDSLYYPLLITTPVGGDGKVQLFVLTDGIVEDGYDPFEKGLYRGLTRSEPIQFRLTRDEIAGIGLRIGAMFKDKACLSAFTYEGSLGMLVQDIMIKQTLPLLMGDLDADGKVNIVDVAIVARAFASLKGQPRWNGVADLNFDNSIDLLDMTAVAKDFGKPA
jgi:hypothetical protein